MNVPTPAMSLERSIERRPAPRRSIWRGLGRALGSVFVVGIWFFACLPSKRK
jgi:hypothetical protein